MTNIDPVHRLSAKEALDRLGMVIYSMTPESLLIEPVITKLLKLDRSYCKLPIPGAFG